jgi:hypothetical protein
MARRLASSRKMPLIRVEGGDVACQVDVNQPIHKVSIASVPQVPTARHTAVARFAAAAIACWVGGCLHLVVVQGAAPRWVEAGVALRHSVVAFL